MGRPVSAPQWPRQFRHCCARRSAAAARRRIAALPTLPSPAPCLYLTLCRSPSPCPSLCPLRLGQDLHHHRPAQARGSGCLPRRLSGRLRWPGPGSARVLPGDLRRPMRRSTARARQGVHPRGRQAGEQLRRRLLVLVLWYMPGCWCASSAADTTPIPHSSDHRIISLAHAAPPPSPSSPAARGVRGPGGGSRLIAG